MTSMKAPWLPSILPSRPALVDDQTTPEMLAKAEQLGKASNPIETPVCICAYPDCFRLFPSKDRLMAHRKREHDSADEDDIVSWKAE